MQEIPAFFLSLKYKVMFKLLAKINKAILPNYTKEHLDLAKATKLQKAIIAYKYWVTINSLN